MSIMVQVHTEIRESAYSARNFPLLCHDKPVFNLLMASHLPADGLSAGSPAD